jgi:predicted nucleic acid-binding protein
MGSFFKKALGLFVEFDDDQNTNNSPEQKTASPISNAVPAASLNQQDMDKFEKHFEKLFSDTNLPGPDYYEFWKISETLETHILDENARISASFASLSIQGLTKEKLIETAESYKGAIEKDKQDFTKAFGDKVVVELQSRNKSILDLERKIAGNTEMIQKLSKEIAESQNKIVTLKTEIVQEEHKLNTSKSGYELACNAMISKINTDIQKIKTIL